MPYASKTRRGPIITSRRFDGVLMTVCQALRLHGAEGVTEAAVWRRIARLGYSFEQAVRTPIKGSGRPRGSVRPAKLRYSLKIVPDVRPNANGRWIDHFSDVPVNYETVVRPGWHIVAIHEAKLPPPNQPDYMHSTLRRL